MTSWIRLDPAWRRFPPTVCESIFPDVWESALESVPLVERGDLMSACHPPLTRPDAAIRLATAHTWSVWEGATSFLYRDGSHIASSGQDEFALAFARIENHCFVNGGFCDADDPTGRKCRWGRMTATASAWTATPSVQPRVRSR
ncbi:MAG: hypothetical protein ABIR62_14845 [Dokdonella sp.]|uniref:hypothetical protein n=1 Tax=Dokdonella sp. TaxID=2291710 RepID=UPI0032640FBC